MTEKDTPRFAKNPDGSSSFEAEEEYTKTQKELDEEREVVKEGETDKTVQELKDLLDRLPSEEMTDSLERIFQKLVSEMEALITRFEKFQ